MKRKVVYLAGPYSGDVEKNLSAAVDIAAELTNLGYSVICPHANSHWVHLRMIQKGMTPLKPTHWYEFDFGLLAKCDMIVLMPNWKESLGAHLEKAFAEYLGIPVYVWKKGDKELEAGGLAWSRKTDCIRRDRVLRGTD